MGDLPGGVFSLSYPTPYTRWSSNFTSLRTHQFQGDTQAFLAAHRDRITVEPLPSYSPDYNPIEYLWKQTKKRATHNQYFEEFALLTVSVDKALAYFARHPDTVLGLFGLYCEESGLTLKQAA